MELMIKKEYKQILSRFSELVLGILASFGRDSYINWPNLLVFWPLLVFQPCHYPKPSSYPYLEACLKAIELSVWSVTTNGVMARLEYKQRPEYKQIWPTYTGILTKTSQNPQKQAPKICLKSACIPSFRLLLFGPPGLPSDSCQPGNRGLDLKTRLIRPGSVES